MKLFWGVDGGMKGRMRSYQVLMKLPRVHMSCVVQSFCIYYFTTCTYTCACYNFTWSRDNVLMSNYHVRIYVTLSRVYVIVITRLSCAYILHVCT